jgi:hypothetical protein
MDPEKNYYERLNGVHPSVLLLEDSPEMERLLRHQARLENTVNRCLNQLRRLRRERANPEPQSRFTETLLRTEQDRYQDLWGLQWCGSYLIEHESPCKPWEFDQELCRRLNERDAAEEAAREELEAKDAETNPPATQDQPGPGDADRSEDELASSVSHAWSQAAGSEVITVPASAPEQACASSLQAV